MNNVKFSFKDSFSGEREVISGRATSQAFKVYALFRMLDMLWKKKKKTLQQNKHCPPTPPKILLLHDKNKKQNEIFNIMWFIWIKDIFASKWTLRILQVYMNI